MLTIALCILCWIFLLSTYSVRQKNLFIFYVTTFSIALVASENIIFHNLLEFGDGSVTYFLFGLENSIYITMVAIFIWFAAYLCNLLNLSVRSKKIVCCFTIPVFIFYTAYKCLKPFFTPTFHISGTWQYSMSQQWGFLSCYIYYCVGLLIILTVFKHRVAPKMVICLQQSVVIALALTIGQSLLPSTTFLTVSFMFPIMAVLMLFHYNSYDVHTGSLDRASLPRYLKDAHGKCYGIYTLQLKDFVFTNENKIALLFIQNAAEIFKHYQVFRITDDILFLVFDKKYNLNPHLLESVIHRRIKSLYNLFHIPYKLTYIDYNTNFIDEHDYILLNEYMLNKMEWNSAYNCTFEDMACISRQLHIKQLLQEIEQSQDLTHPNVKVYCQPIWNLKTESYSSVEVLSRLLVQGNIVLPEEYLSLAIQHGYIFSYNKVVFNQACTEFAKMLESGLQLDVLSMNFSVQEFTSPTFINDIMEIIEKHKIPCQKIAIEITESTGTSQAEIVKEVIWKLKTRGIQVYLDDFGTDYSNIDRILNLPVDVIKFDRSLTWSMRDKEKLHNIISSMVSSFSQAGYKILFEGIETEDDVRRCGNMDTTYLQGFKYSKPIEIELLPKFLVNATKTASSES